MVKVGAVVVLYNPDFDVTKKTLSSLGRSNMRGG